MELADGTVAAHSVMLLAALGGAGAVLPHPGQGVADSLLADYGQQPGAAASVVALQAARQLAVLAVAEVVAGVGERALKVQQI